MGKVVCGLRDTHVRIICPVISLMWENVPGPLPLNCTASDGKLGEGLGMRLVIWSFGASETVMMCLPTCVCVWHATNYGMNLQTGLNCDL